MIDKRLLGLMQHTKKYITSTVLWNLLSLIFHISIIFILAGMIKSVRLHTYSNTLFIVGLACILLLIGLKHLCYRKSAKSGYRASMDVKQTLRARIFEKLVKLNGRYEDILTTSELVQISMEGVEQLEIYFGKYLPQFFYSILAPLTLFLVLAPLNINSASILFICVPLIPASIIAVQKLAKRLLAKYWGKYTSLGDSFLENLQGLTTLKIYQADERKTKEMDEEAENFRKITMKVLIMQLNSISIMDLVAYGGAAVGILVALLEYRGGNISFEVMFIIVLLSSEFFIPMRLLGSFFHIAMNGMAASDKIFCILDREISKEHVQQLEGITDVNLEHVKFSYDETRTVLEDINLKIKDKEFIGIVGESGCGKSTITKLLTGLYPSYEGSIKLGEVEINTCNRRALLQQITLVAHNGYLFTGTVEENLRMGKSNATDKEMIAVLKEVNLWDTLVKKEGLQSEIKEQGSNLSGGQRQRLVLARAILRDTPMYIFDEATSNIDVESEEAILSYIHKQKGKKSILMISHRLANTVPCDCIYLLEKGYVKEVGNHEELMLEQGSYYKMFQLQQEFEEIRKGGEEHA